MADPVVRTAGTLTSNLPIIGGGSQAVSVGTRSGNTTEFATVTGSKTVSKQLVFDASGNVIASASDVGGALPPAEVTLSSANILALHTTPITLVAAPGAGMVIEPISIRLRLNYNSVQYSLGNNLLVKYTNAAGEQITTTSALTSSFVNSPASAQFRSTFSLQGTAAAALIENQPLTLSVVDAFTTGNSTLTVVVIYQIIDFN